MRVAIQGDIGQPVYHVGDEAMTHAAVDRFTERRLTDLVLLTRSQQQTREHYGPEIRTARTLQFPWAPVDRERYLWEIKAVMAGETRVLPPHDQVFELIETLREVDALFIAGGGNLNSRYGWLLYERAAIAHIAVALGKQVVIGGQTLGPEFSAPDAGTVVNLLRNASLVGLREHQSFLLAKQLVPRHTGFRPCFDDASALSFPETAQAAGDAYIAVTFSAPPDYSGEATAARAYARLVDVVSQRLDAPLLFVPHMATPGAQDGDVAFHAHVARYVTSAIVGLLPIQSARTTCGLTKGAVAAVSSRYHPVVFAASGGVPSLAVAPDYYTATRIAGAWHRFGLRQQPIRLDRLLSGGVVDGWLDSLERPALPPDGWEMEHANWWDQVTSALTSPKGRHRKHARHVLRKIRHQARRRLPGSR